MAGTDASRTMQVSMVVGHTQSSALIPQSYNGPAGPVFGVILDVLGEGDEAIEAGGRGGADGGTVGTAVPRHLLHAGAGAGDGQVGHAGRELLQVCATVAGS